jgi:hypothetical protein
VITKKIIRQLGAEAFERFIRNKNRFGEKRLGLPVLVTLGHHLEVLELAEGKIVFYKVKRSLQKRIKQAKRGRQYQGFFLEYQTTIKKT